MIKGLLGYLKYLKLFGILFGISCFMGLGVNSVNAGYIGHAGYLQQSVYNDGYDIQVNGLGNLLTQYYGVGKRVFMIQDGVYFFRSSNGKPYGYVNYYDGEVGQSAQGFFESYALCDYIGLGTGASGPENCTKHSIVDGSNTARNRILGSLSNSGYYYYDYGKCRTDGKNFAGFTICFSSLEFNKSLCFYGGLPNYNRYVCSVGGLDSLYYIYHGGGDSEYLSNLTGSLDLRYSFDSIDNSILGTSPGDDGSINGGSQTTNGSYQMTGDLVIDSCTKQKALTWYECQGYVSDLCYSSYGNNTDKYQGQENGPYNDIEIPGQDIFSIYSDTRYLRRGGITGDSFNYNDWFSYWRNTYNVYKHNSDSITNPFIGTPVSLFMYFGQVDDYGLPYTNESIVEYCMIKEYQSNRLSEEYTGVASNVVCNLSPIEIVDCSLAVELGGGGVGGVGASGTVGVVGSSWVGITNRSGYNDRPGGNVVAQLQTYNDGKSFENNFFNVLKSNFKYPNESGGSPLLPTYIIIALCGLILFRFMSH